MLRVTRLALVSAVLAAPAWATTYMTVPQAQAAMLPGQALRAAPVDLSPDQVAAIRKAAGVQPLSPRVRAWRATDGDWFIVDEVVGKHEFITYAVTLDRAGTVKGVEILDYKETYGGQVRDPRWRQQFVGRRPDQQLRLGAEVRNISGATLSSKHITDGVRRILATWTVALRGA